MLPVSEDAVALTSALVSVGSVSGDERELADQIEATLRGYPGNDPGNPPGLRVQRDGNVVLARTELGRAQRIVLAGHLDTVPVAGNAEPRREGERLYGCGSTDMKSGIAIMLRIAHLAGVGALVPRFDLTWVYYDCEEVEAARNGLGRIARERPDALQADLAILLEPTSGLIEGGCQGTLRAVVRSTGVRAHSARSWLGVNAIHAAGDVLSRLSAYQARTVDVDGLAYREGLSAVGISGGVAGNVIPDECDVVVNYRFAPDRSEAQAQQHVRDVFSGYAVEIIDSAPGARPGLDAPLARALAEAIGGDPRPKLGWTDVARFGELGIPAVNFGPGDPELAHTAGEYVETGRIVDGERALVRFLESSS